MSTQDGQILECRQGDFPERGISPLVGDEVQVENGVISRILPEKSDSAAAGCQHRPGNMVVSADKPQPNLLILDKLIAVCEAKRSSRCLFLQNGSG